MEVLQTGTQISSETLVNSKNSTIIDCIGSHMLCFNIIIPFKALSLILFFQSSSILEVSFMNCFLAWLYPSHYMQRFLSLQIRNYSHATEMMHLETYIFLSILCREHCQLFLSISSNSVIPTFYIFISSCDCKHPLVLSYASIFVF